MVLLVSTTYSLSQHNQYVYSSINKLDFELVLVQCSSMKLIEL